MGLRRSLVALVVVLSCVGAGGGDAVAAGETCGGLPATIVGTSAGEVLVGTPGQDVIVGAGGADTISGAGSGDVICPDSADGGPALADPDAVDAGDGDDAVLAGGGVDEILGGDGDDYLEGGDGDDLIRDGAGRDFVSAGAGADRVFSSAGEDHLEGGEGDDAIQVEAGPTYLDGGSGADVLRGGTDGDYLDGGPGDDFAFGQGGGTEPDFYDGGAGADHLAGSADGEYLQGGPGPDRLHAAGGEDYLDGGEDGDELEGGRGSDFFDAGQGDDALLALDREADVEFSCGTGVDTVSADPVDDSSVPRPDCEGDSDGDGLLDVWEEQGYDADGDSAPEVDLPSLGADKLRKDVFVRVVWLAGPGGHTHKPSQEALDEVATAFATAPVGNPGSLPGIDLHLELAGPVTETAANRVLAKCSGGKYDWSWLDEIKRTGRGGASYLTTEEARIYHFALIGHSARNCKGGGFGGQSRNAFDGDDGPDVTFADGAGDFFVTQSTASQRVVAATFMHELGHNLGLGHGGVALDSHGEPIGADHVNGKPNHLSVMNYSFQNGIPTKLFGDLPGGSRLDYSRFGDDVLPDLDEREASEALGLGAPSLPTYESKYYCAGGESALPISDLDAPVNWNCEGSDDETVFDVDFTGSALWEESPEIQDHPLSTANEWEAIVFDGGAIGQAGPPVELPAETVGTIAPEPTLEQLAATRIGTTIVAKATPSLLIRLRLEARLRAIGSGDPIAGREVRFRLGHHGPGLCAARTDSAGVARCTALALLAPLLARHVVATFAGDDAYVGSQDGAS